MLYPEVECSKSSDLSCDDEPDMSSGGGFGFVYFSNFLVSSSCKTLKSSFSK